MIDEEDYGEDDVKQKLSRVFQREAERTGKEKLLLTCATGIEKICRKFERIIYLFLAAARHRIEAGYEVEEVCK